MPPPSDWTPVLFPVTTECATRRVAEDLVKSPTPLLLATTLRSMTTVAAPPDPEDVMTPVLALLEAALSTMVTLSDPPGVDARPTKIPVLSTKIPKKLLAAETFPRTPVTTAQWVGRIAIPELTLLAAIVFDTKKLLDVVGPT